MQWVCPPSRGDGFTTRSTAAEVRGSCCRQMREPVPWRDCKRLPGTAHSAARHAVRLLPWRRAFPAVGTVFAATERSTQGEAESDMSKRLHGFFIELRLIWLRARQVWRLVPAQHKWALGIATAVIAGVSVCNTALPILLGHLVDDVKAGSDQGVGQGKLFWLAGTILLM